MAVRKGGRYIKDPKTGDIKRELPKDDTKKKKSTPKKEEGK